MNAKRVDWVVIGGGRVGSAWALGKRHVVSDVPSQLAVELQELVGKGEAEVFVFWDHRFAPPSAEFISRYVDEIESGRLDCIHAGLLMGMNGQPSILGSINPGWMLDAEAPPGIESTSWRCSLRACVLSARALRGLGGPRACFESLEMASLEMGHRWIRNGALMRHVPGLAHDGMKGLLPAFDPSLSESLKFSILRFGSKWTQWALGRWILRGKVGLLEAMSSWRKARGIGSQVEPKPLRPVPSVSWAASIEPIARRDESSNAPRVSVLIPTVDRYPYLRILLGQLREQNVKPFEIIIVDQTRGDRRDRGLCGEFPDLAIRYIEQDEPGQCSSRNAGLLASRGDYVLFIDDDDEVRSDLIARHLATLETYAADVSCGIAEEVGAGVVSADFRQVRASDVFPTNNAMVRRKVLHGSGLFDLAYDKRQRADGDLGCRMYLSGAKMVLDPTILVLHHHAPSGGLRKHKARVVTYAMSRRLVFAKALCSASELYLTQRYFRRGTDVEVLWMSLLGTFSFRGGIAGKFLKAMYALVTMPHSLWVLRGRRLEASAMRQKFPVIARLTE